MDPFTGEGTAEAKAMAKLLQKAQKKGTLDVCAFCGVHSASKLKSCGKCKSAKFCDA